MQSTATVQTEARGLNNVKRTTSAAGKTNADQTEFADPFLQIIMSILAQTQDMSIQLAGGQTQTGEETGLSGLEALVGNSSAGMAALLGTMLDSGSDLSAAAVLNADAALNADTVLNADTALNADAAQTGTANAAVIAEDALLALAALETMAPAQESGETGTNALWQAYAAQPVQAQDLAALAGLLAKSAGAAETAEASLNTQAQAQAADLSELSELPGKDELQPLMKNAAIEVLSDETDSGRSDFSDAVVKAKQMLSENLSQQTGDKDQDDADVDKLISEMTETKTSSPFEIRLKAASDTGEAKVLAQITDGIKQNLSLGKSEFSIRLKPETLGEITVKLVEEAGKTTLTITTASAHTAKIINSDIDALREAVAPMNVEVHNAVTQTNESAGGSMQQFNMSGQQFAGQQFAGQQSFNQTAQAAAQTENRAADDSYAAAQAETVRVLSGERLNTYV